MSRILDASRPCEPYTAGWIGGCIQAVRPYAAIARPDHWFKNGFMLLGVVLACFCYPGVLTGYTFLAVLGAAACTCLAASSNYVINEILDAPTDRHHPVKRNRPVPSGQVRLPWAYAEWIALGGLSLGLATAFGGAFFWTIAWLLAMGIAYNVPPVRTKELPYVDVLSESVNNPIRLMLGWFAVSPTAVPPVSLLVAYWMLGAFFMATKRFSEYRSLGDGQRAASYRRSFRHYDESRLLVSMVFYAIFSALFLGVFIIRYHLELILSVPLIAGFFCYYLHVALKPDSAAQNPERLYREKGLMIYLGICLFAFAGLMFVQVPALYGLFNVQASPIPPLWTM